MIVKVIELMASSPNSWDEAAKTAVEKASKSVKNIKSAWVKDQSVIVNNGKVTEFRVSLKVTFGVD